MHKYSSILKKALFIIFIFESFVSSAQYYPDQYFEIYGPQALLEASESVSNIVISNNGKYLVLENEQLSGTITFQATTLNEEFNRGLPSWNAVSPSESSSVKAEMRFFVNDNWSNWVTVGYWNKLLWSYGSTSFSGGYVDVDYIKLNTYVNTFQFRINFKRTSTNEPSSRLKQIAFFASDTEYPIDISAITADNPSEIFIDTEHIYQYDVDDEIGGRICSPVTTTMIIKSYGKDVDAYEFALKTYDPYWDIFGGWPRAVTHASEYGLRGAVTRYRTWSDAFDVLQNGGRIAMSVGQPLYSGHLMMLAGFDAGGNPIVHDPAKSNGYAYVYDKYDLSASWFNKGGIAYTFYEDHIANSISSVDKNEKRLKAYPNPIKNIVYFEFSLEEKQQVKLEIYDLSGRYIVGLLNSDAVHTGKNIISKNIADYNLSPGIYTIRLSGNTFCTNVMIVVQ